MNLVIRSPVHLIKFRWSSFIVIHGKQFNQSKTCSSKYIFSYQSVLLNIGDRSYLLAGYSCLNSIIKFRPPEYILMIKLFVIRVIGKKDSQPRPSTIGYFPVFYFNPSLVSKRKALFATLHQPFI